MNINSMKHTFFFLGVLLVVSCGNKKTEEGTTNEAEGVSTEIVEKEEAPILLGTKDRKDLEAEPYGDLWFDENYRLHTADSETIAQFKDRLGDVSHVKLFMGTWCSDSQREVPAFYKIMDEAGFDHEKLQLITVSRDKDTPEKLEEGLDITNVPTFIFYRENKEINRIVEAPVETLEKDMLSILSGKDYKHLYAE